MTSEANGQLVDLYIMYRDAKEGRFYAVKTSLEEKDWESLSYCDLVYVYKAVEAEIEEALKRPPFGQDHVPHFARVFSDAKKVWQR